MKKIQDKYQAEYEKSKSCFWDTAPAKYVKLFNSFEGIDISKYHVLDLGAGEGKNAVFLANLSAQVIAVDISPIALGRFKYQPNFEECRNKLTIINEDIRKLNFRKANFDLIVAYGILHCLNSKDEISLMLKKIKEWLKPGGYFICATFTDEIPVPEVQSYLKIESFLKRGELENNLDEFTIIKLEYSTITETHSTSMIEHSHSLIRLIAKKNEQY